ncbi:hypothetical protein LJ656_16685 [Paraburkholderia sp. MMS20-SJTR3]|uniref:Uncharacterized protein n=1 Tax=Paraburkholderia sejongensis TaxID=2886946 RepID=A0ABS8JWF9_9BURK|nr:hypothetical protein [Paraburkholderia sp. MMS20-SJTR3]MCC8394236.1 hypothetical protein [Paraburkholderia sp. MMS20-SJTR3]
MDWLDVRLRTARPTQFQHVQSALDTAGAGKLHVTPIEPGPGGVADTFVVRVTDHLANDYAALSKALAEFVARYPLAHAPEIAAIEVACDFLHTGEVEREAATRAMTYRLQSSLLTDGDSPRQFDPARRKNRFMDAHGERLDPLLNYREGNKWDYVSWHVYWKRTDCGQPLPPTDWRARVEVTLNGHALQDVGLVKLADLDGYKFTTLARFFRFRTPIAPETQAKGDRFKLAAITINRRLNDATPARGLHSFRSIGQRDRWRKLRRESSHLQADNELQDAIKDALRRLNI